MKLILKFQNTQLEVACVVFMFSWFLGGCGPDLKRMPLDQLYDNAEDAVFYNDYREASMYFQEIKNRGGGINVLYQLAVALNQQEQYGLAYENLVEVLKRWNSHENMNITPGNNNSEFKFNCFREMIFSLENILQNESLGEDKGERDRITVLLNEARDGYSLEKEKLEYWENNPAELKEHYENKLFEQAKQNKGHVQIGWSLNEVRAVLGNPGNIETSKLDFLPSGAKTKWVYFKTIEVMDPKLSPFEVYLPGDATTAPPSGYMKSPTFDANGNMTSAGSWVSTSNPTISTQDTKKMISGAEENSQSTKTKVLEVYFDENDNVIRWLEKFDGYEFGESR